MVTLLGYELERLQSEALLVAQQRTQDLAAGLEVHTRESMEQIDRVLQQVQSEFHSRPAAPGAVRVNDHLARLLAAIPQSQGLWVTDFRGNVTDSAIALRSGINIGDRNYFQRQKKALESALQVSEPVFSRGSENWVITLSRRLVDREGHFSGLVVAAISADSLQAHFSTLEVGKGGLVALYDDQLRLVARVPPLPGQLGRRGVNPAISDPIRRAERGSFAAVSHQDGVDRIFGFHRLEKLPLVVLVGLSRDEVLSAWHQKLAHSAMAVLALVLPGLILVYIYLTPQLKRWRQWHNRSVPQLVQLPEERF